MGVHEPLQRIEHAHEAYLAEPDTGEVVPSMFLGEAGILLVRWRLTRTAHAAERLAAAGAIGAHVVAEAIRTLGVDPNKIDAASA